MRFIITRRECCITYGPSKADVKGSFLMFHRNPFWLRKGYHFLFHLFVDSSNLYLDATSRLKPKSHMIKQKEKKKTQEIARGALNYRTTTQIP